MIRHHIPVKAALLFFHAMILSHLSYCVTVWGQASKTTVKPITSLHKQALKIMDQKPTMWHHCYSLLQKYKLFNFDSFMKFAFLKLTFKCSNNFAPAVLCPFVTKGGSGWQLHSRGAQNHFRPIMFFSDRDPFME